MLIAILLILLLAGCSTTNQAVNNQDTSPNQPAAQIQENAVGEQAAEHEPEATSTSGPDCYGPEIHPVGQSIADQFEDETSYDEVMVWFCNGVQFDDILTALQTEVLTSVNAEELLEMLGSGLTWDDIWVEIGLTEE